MTRVLVVHPGAHFSVADVHNGWVEGLQEVGCETYDFHFDTRIDFYTGAHLKQDGEFKPAFGYPDACHLANHSLRAACYDFWPDVVLVVSGFFITVQTMEIIRARNTKVALLLTESPYEETKQAKLAEYADLVLLNDPTNVDQYHDAHFFPHAYRPSLHKPGKGRKEWEADFGFVGTGYASRVEFFEQVDWDGITTRFGGHWVNTPEDGIFRRTLVHDVEVCMDNVDTVDLYRSVKCSANLYRKEANDGDHSDGWAMGPREVELAATGTFFLREPRPESDLVLDMLPVFHNPEEFSESLRWWVTHDTQRIEAAAKAQASVADRTFANSAKRLLSLLNT